jgi:hypothetical protein
MLWETHGIGSRRNLIKKLYRQCTPIITFFISFVLLIYFSSFIYSALLHSSDRIRLPTEAAYTATYLLLLLIAFIGALFSQGKQRKWRFFDVPSIHEKVASRRIKRRIIFFSVKISTYIALFSIFLFINLFKAPQLIDGSGFSLKRMLDFLTTVPSSKKIILYSSNDILEPIYSFIFLLCAGVCILANLTSLKANFDFFFSNHQKE